MVVDEDIERRQQLREALTRHDLSVHCVSSPARALQMYPVVKPCVLIVTSPATGAFLSYLRTVQPQPAIITMGHGPRAPEAMLGASLPDAAPPEQVAAEAARFADAGRDIPKPHKATVLLVDDEPQWRQILKEFLELHGLVTDAVGTGEEALIYLAREHPKVLVLDIRMPGMDGLLTLKHIRVYHPNLPVVIVSQADEDRVREEAGVLGAHDYLIKPVNLEALARVVRQHVGEPR